MSEQEAERKPAPRRKEKPGPFYKLKREGLEDAEITPKQLRHWREQGLFRPELGEGSRFLTQLDIRRLAFLRRLIVGLGLPVEVVKRLLDDLYTRKRWEAKRFPERFYFLDLERDRLVDKDDALQTLLIDLKGNLGSDDSYRQIEDWLQTLAAVLLASLASQHRNPAVYEAARDAGVARIKGMDLVARIERFETGDGGVDYRLSPSLDDDPPLDWHEMVALFEQRVKRLEGWFWDVPF